MSGRDAVTAVTFDIGNTLFPFRRREMDDLLDRFADRVARRLGACDRATLIRRYDEVRQDQYRVNLPHLRENDLVDRIRLALEAVTGPGAVSPELLALTVEDYLDCLTESLPLPPGVSELLDQLGRCYRLGVITNYPYAPGTRRLLAASGLASSFQAVIISAEWGFVKPHPLLFRQAACELGVDAGSLVHVGDDWLADIAGAAGAGARSVYFTGWRDEPDPECGTHPGSPIAVIERLEALPGLISVLGGVAD